MRRYLLTALLFILLAPQLTRGDDAAEQPFQPVWQLLNQQEKQQFISGYLFGMRDAATMTGVLRDFVKENPSAAGESLDKLRSIYEELASGKPDSLSAELDRFYKDQRNKEAPLSRAITAARGKS